MLYDREALEKNYKTAFAEMEALTKFLSSAEHKLVNIKTEFQQCLHDTEDFVSSSNEIERTTNLKMKHTEDFISSINEIETTNLKIKPTEDFVSSSNEIGTTNLKTQNKKSVIKPKMPTKHTASKRSLTKVSKINNAHSMVVHKNVKSTKEKFNIKDISSRRKKQKDNQNKINITYDLTNDNSTVGSDKSIWSDFLPHQKINKKEQEQPMLTAQKEPLLNNKNKFNEADTYDFKNEPPLSKSSPKRSDEKIDEQILHLQYKTSNQSSASINIKKVEYFEKGIQVEDEVHLQNLNVYETNTDTNENDFQNIEKDNVKIKKRSLLVNKLSKLAVQEMPKIDIKRPLVMQKVPNLVINPEETLPEKKSIDNIKYVACVSESVIEDERRDSNELPTNYKKPLPTIMIDPEVLLSTIEESSRSNESEDGIIKIRNEQSPKVIDKNKDSYNIVPTNVLESKHQEEENVELVKEKRRTLKEEFNLEQEYIPSINTLKAIQCYLEKKYSSINQNFESSKNTTPRDINLSSLSGSEKYQEISELKPSKIIIDTIKKAEKPKVIDFTKIFPSNQIAKSCFETSQLLLEKMKNLSLNAQQNVASGKSSPLPISDHNSYSIKKSANNSDKTTPSVQVENKTNRTSEDFEILPSDKTQHLKFYQQAKNTASHSDNLELSSVKNSKSTKKTSKNTTDRSSKDSEIQLSDKFHNIKFDQEEKNVTTRSDLPEFLFIRNDKASKRSSKYTTDNEPSDVSYSDEFEDEFQTKPNSSVPASSSTDENTPQNKVSYEQKYQNKEKSTTQSHNLSPKDKHAVSETQHKEISSNQNKSSTHSSNSSTADKHVISKTQHKEINSDQKHLGSEKFNLDTSNTNKSYSEERKSTKDETYSLDEKESGSKIKLLQEASIQTLPLENAKPRKHWSRDMEVQTVNEIANNDKVLLEEHDVLSKTKSEIQPKWFQEIGVQTTDQQITKNTSVLQTNDLFNNDNIVPKWSQDEAIQTSDITEFIVLPKTCNSVNDDENVDSSVLESHSSDTQLNQSNEVSDDNHLEQNIKKTHILSNKPTKEVSFAVCATEIEFSDNNSYESMKNDDNPSLPHDTSINEQAALKKVSSISNSEHHGLDKIDSVQAQGDQPNSSRHETSIYSEIEEHSLKASALHQPLKTYVPLHKYKSKEADAHTPFYNLYENTAYSQAVSTTYAVPYVQKSVQTKKLSISSHSSSSDSASEGNNMTLSEGEVMLPCKCSTSIGEIHLCKYAKNIKMKVNNSARTEANKLLARAVGARKVKISKQKMNLYSDRFVTYTYTPEYDNTLSTESDTYCNSSEFNTSNSK